MLPQKTKPSSSRHHAASYFPTFPTTALSYGSGGGQGSEEGPWAEEDENPNAGDYYAGYSVDSLHGNGADDGDDYVHEGDADEDGLQLGEEDHYPDSMTSSVRAHCWEGGFRYHSYREGLYCFPNDEVEQNRDDMKHKLALLLCNGHPFYAPIKDRLASGANVLDLGE